MTTDKVFIRRDLTYSQRAELREHWLNKRPQQVSGEHAETAHSRVEQPHNRETNVKEVQSQQGK